MKKPTSLTPLAAVLLGLFVATSSARAQLTQDFESFTANTPAPALSGWGANTADSISVVSSLVTSASGEVLAGSNSFLLTFDAAANTPPDFDIGGYYSGINGGAFTSIAPGDYTLTATFRALDPGFTTALNFYYTAFNADYSIQTTNVGLQSPFYSSADGTVSWTSGVFTINSDGPNFFTGLQTRAFVGSSAVNGARVVIDSVVLTAIPEPSSFALIAGFGTLLAVGIQRRRR